MRQHIPLLVISCRLWVDKCRASSRLAGIAWLIISLRLDMRESVRDQLFLASLHAWAGFRVPCRGGFGLWAVTVTGRSDC